MQETLHQAIQLHRAGQLEPAAGLYRRILEQNPEDADALHLLGVVHVQRRQPGLAVALLSRAVALRPEAAEFYVNLAEAHRLAGQAESALRSCDEALRLRPGLAEAIHNRALAQHDLQQRDQTIESLRRQVQQMPDPATHAQLAALLRQIGKSDEALLHFEHAARRAPADAVAQANVGQMLLSLERYEEALPYCREAVRLRPDLATLRLILGDAFRLLEMYGEANAAYVEAIRLEPILPRAHANLGLLYRAQKRTYDAFGPLQKAVALEPANAVFWKHLADAHADWEDYPEAIRCWRRALELQPLEPTLRLGLATALLETGAPDEAERHLGFAERQQPDSSNVQLALAKVHQQRGEQDKAETALRTAMRLLPGRTRAPCHLARMLGARLPDADVLDVERNVADPECPDDLRAGFYFALASVLDGRGDYHGAATHASKAHAIISKSDARRNPYSADAHRRFIDKQIEAFGAGRLQLIAGAGVASDRPVFVFGLPRSGTTLVEQILASHPRVHGAGELHLGFQSHQAISDDSILAGSVARPAERHLQGLDARVPQPGKVCTDRVVDKMPANYLYLGVLAALFPRATFIHCRRDLRDVAVSCWLTEFQWLDWTHDFRDIAMRFEDYLRIMDHWHKVLPLLGVTIHEIVYEEVVADLEVSAHRLIDACGLAWDPACLEFHRQRRPVRTASAQQVSQPIYRHALGRWKNYQSELSELFAMMPIDIRA